MASLPMVVLEKASKAEESLIPKKSSALYEKEYIKFRKWMETNNVNIICETVVLAYISELVSLSYFL